MKHLLNIFTIITFLSIICFPCHAQKIMGTINEAQRLKENEKLFINQPLKKLLKEIGPEIKMVIADPRGNGAGLGFFIFRFVDAKHYDSA